MDGLTFDHLDTTWLAKTMNVVTSGGYPQIVADTGRGSTKALSVTGTGYAWMTHAATSTPMFTGAFFIPSTIPAGGLTLVSFMDGGTAQCRLRVKSDGTLVALRQDTEIGTPSVISVLTGAYYGLCVLPVIANSGGTFQVYLNADPTPVLDLSGLDTQATANTTANSWRLGGVGAESSNQVRWKDIAWAQDGVFRGDLKCVVDYPTGDGALMELTASSGSTAYNLLDEVIPDSADKVSGTAGKVLLTFPALPYTPDTIHAVITEVAISKSDTGDRFWSDLYRVSSTNYAGTPAAMSTTELLARQVRTVHPVSGVAFTKTTLDALQQGFEIT